MDFGTIMCWADNMVGQQKEPCVFHLIAAGKPDMPFNCTLVNQTSESLEVDCSPGNINFLDFFFYITYYDHCYHYFIKFSFNIPYYKIIMMKIHFFIINALFCFPLSKIITF